MTVVLVPPEDDFVLVGEGVQLGLLDDLVAYLVDELTHHTLDTLETDVLVGQHLLGTLLELGQTQVLVYFDEDVLQVQLARLEQHGQTLADLDDALHGDAIVALAVVVGVFGGQGRLDEGGGGEAGEGVESVFVQDDHVQQDEVDGLGLGIVQNAHDVGIGPLEDHPVLVLHLQDQHELLVQDQQVHLVVQLTDHLLPLE